MPDTNTTIAGISTLGITFSYGSTQAGGTQIPRCNSISGIELSTETIDASALEDETERSIAGRQSTGGEWTVTFNATPESLSAISGMLSAGAAARQNGTKIYFVVTIPGLGTFTVSGQPGTKVPLPDISQNELLTVDISITIEEYIGFAAAST